MPYDAQCCTTGLYCPDGYNCYLQYGEQTCQCSDDSCSGGDVSPLSATAADTTTSDASLPTNTGREPGPTNTGGEPGPTNTGVDFSPSKTTQVTSASTKAPTTQTTLSGNAAPSPIRGTLPKAFVVAFPVLGVALQALR
jgi:hypothetical protein